MTPTDDEVSILQLGTSLLRHRWQIFRWMFAGAILAFAISLGSKLSYTSSASFIPEATHDAARSGLASLAGQFGISVSGGDAQANSPDFYSDLLKSRVILSSIVTDTFSVPEEHIVRQPLMDVLKIEGPTPERRVELAIMKLRTMEQTSIVIKTGVVQVSVTAPWPSLSVAITRRLVAAVNAFNLRARQGQASEERRFTETRLEDARTALRGAEDRLQGFLQRNRQFGTPELKFEQDRLEREVMLDQQVVSSLAQSYEEVRIREVRDTPVITTIEPPSTPTQPNPRGRGRWAVTGLMLGALVGVTLALLGDFSRRKRAAGDPEAEAFSNAVRDTRNDIARVIPGLRKSAPRES
jgi:uncharacterized protein involved in exopolysaccharide biosynthesis